MALHHAKHGEVVHLPACAEGAGMKALVKTEQFEAIHLVVNSGSTIPPHRVTGQATLQCLRGRVRVALPEASVTLAQGDWMYLDRAEEHGVEGIEDAALLVTILFDTSHGSEQAAVQSKDQLRGNPR